MRERARRAAARLRCSRVGLLSPAAGARAALRGAAVAALLIGAAGCNPPRDPQVRVIDLLNTAMAERHPARAEFHVEEHTFGPRRRASLVVPADSRAIWQMTLPRRATLRTSVGVAGDPKTDAVTFRIAVSDHRIYEPLVVRTVTAADSAQGWIPLAADLSRYAGWQWSLFYRPEGRSWRIILTVGREAGAPEKAFWALPGIDTDVRSAKRFVAKAGL